MCEMTKPPPRLRLTSDIDIKKIDPDCERCKGSGVVRIEKMDDPSNPGIELKVPVVCRCVPRNGGVEIDMLDRFIKAGAEQLGNGIFAQNLADDILRLPRSAKVNAIAQLEKEAVNMDKGSTYRAQVMGALEIILKKTRREA